MAIKKSELYSSLWKSCDELRGGMDASQYKDYVLVLLFVKYVSDKYANDKDALIEIPRGGSFKDMAAAKGNKEIGDRINKIISKLAEANDLKGVIDVADFNDDEKLGKGKEMIDRLTNLVSIFENPELDFSKNRADGDDILGDAYEYLMRHFATESGKSKGQFYTPAEVSRIMAKLIGISKAKSSSESLYDPTCGSGSLLLKAADETDIKISIYGQEMDNATRALAKMNMILHDNDSAEILQGNTLAKPLFINDKTGQLKTFDYVVSNPPFSTKSWSNGLDPRNDLYGRFEDGIPPTKNGDYVDALDNYWKVYPDLKSKLFKKISGRNGYYELKIEQKYIRLSIFSHSEFTNYANEINQVCLNWHKRNAFMLKEIKKNDKPKQIIFTLSENLLSAFAGKQLIDNYDIYQYLMTYWANTMQDDIYALVTDGWEAGNQVEFAENKRDWEGKIIPKQLLISRYFRKEKEAIENLEADRDAVTRTMEEMSEEYSGEDGFLEEIKNEKGKITKVGVLHRMREIKSEIPEMRIAAEPKVKYGNQDDETNEFGLLEKYSKLIELEADTNKRIKQEYEELERKLLAKYKALHKEEIKTLIIDDKWMGHINREVQNEMDKVSQRLAQRINELVERYASPLPQLIETVKTLEKKVNSHLSKIAFQ